MFDMLTALKNMAEEKDSAKFLNFRNCRKLSCAPFQKAVNSETTAFFLHAPMSDISLLYEHSRGFFPDEIAPNFFEYKQLVRSKAEYWMRDSRHHVDRMSFVRTHLINVILQWPTKKTLQDLYATKQKNSLKVIGHMSRRK